MNIPEIIAVGLFGLTIQYFSMGLLVVTYVFFTVIGFISIVTLWLLFSKKTKISKAKYYLEKILKGDLTDPKDIIDQWFIPVSNIWAYVLSGLFIGIGVGIFLLNKASALSFCSYIPKI